MYLQAKVQAFAREAPHATNSRFSGSVQKIYFSFLILTTSYCEFFGLSKSGGCMGKVGHIVHIWGNSSQLTMYVNPVWMEMHFTPLWVVEELLQGDWKIITKIQRNFCWLQYEVLRWILEPGLELGLVLRLTLGFRLR